MTISADVIWYKNNKIVISNQTMKVRTDDCKSTLTINPVTREDYGPIVCKAICDSGIVESRAKLIESSASSAVQTVVKVEEKAEIKKSDTKVEKKKGKTTRRTRVQKKKSYEEDEEEEEEQIITVRSEVVEQKSSMKIRTQEDIIVQEIIENEPVRELEHKTFEKTISITDIAEIKHSVEVNEILESMRAPEFGPGEGPLRELATIAYLVRHGVSVSDITTFYQTDSFPALQTPESQAALVQLLEREGHANIVSEVLTEETEIDEAVIATAGFRAFMRMVEMKHATVEEIITHFSPADFVSQDWKVEDANQVKTISLCLNCSTI